MSNGSGGPVSYNDRPGRRELTDEEVVRRLRRTLRAEAEAVRPGSPIRVAAGHRRHRPQRTARVVAGLAAAAVVAAIVAVATSLHHPPGVNVTTAGATTTPSASVGSSASPGSSGSAAPNASAGTATSVPSQGAASAAGAASTGVAPLSITFVSADEGWLLGTQACPEGTCLRLARTVNRGLTWTGTSTPPRGLPAELHAGDTLQVRFADPADGWVFGQVSGAPVVWATTDGGAAWTRVSLPGLGAGGQVEDIETVRGVVDALILPAAGDLLLDTAKVEGGRWQTAVTVPRGSGPHPSAELVLQATGGWVLVDNGGVVGGAILAGSTWEAWADLPCQSAGGPAELAAASATELVAVCQVKKASAAHPPLQVWSSTDGGTSPWQAGPVLKGVGASLRINFQLTAASAPGKPVLVGAGGTTGTALLSSPDGGVTWTTRANIGLPIVQVGFEDANQGVAVARSGTVGELLMTPDGGGSWTQVGIPTAG